jgi:hypothetical protein
VRRNPPHSPEPHRRRAGRPLLGNPLVALASVAMAAAALLVAGACTKAQLSDPKTYDDLGTAACEILAGKKIEDAQAQGVSFADVKKTIEDACAVKEHTQPFIDALLAAEQEEQAAMGAAMGVKAD